MSRDPELKILVVDDRSENLLSMKQLLRRSDLEVLTAESGEEALSLMLDHDLALVLLDVQMPGMDGFEVASLMRGNERTRHIPIIFVTAISKEQQHIFSGYEAGAVDYLFKPVDPFIIRAKVDVFLELKRMEMIRQKLMDELSRANRRLHDLSENKSDFLSAASHELRTPLTVIKENCALVLDEIVGPISADQRKCMDAALRNCNRLADLVNDLLDLDTIESGCGTLIRGKTELTGLLNTCAEDFAGRCRSAGLDLYVEIADDLPAVLGEEGLVTQVVVNLIGNAIKFTPEGGRVALGAFATDDGVAIRVQDDGPGIAAEDQERIFEKFTQVNRTHRPGAQGTGLGLAISRKIAGLLEGELSLASEAGVGSTFSLTLPRFSEERRLRAFVRDATRNLLGVQQDWTLLLLDDPATEGAPQWLDAEVGRVIRYGDDRVQMVRVGDQELLGVLLKTDVTGAASFLTRLEETVTRRTHEASTLRYAIRELDENDQVALEIAEEELMFMNLNLGTEPIGENSEQGKDPGSR